MQSFINKSTFGLIEEFHKHKITIFFLFSLICGGSSTMEAKHRHKDDFVVRTIGAPSTCMLRLMGKMGVFDVWSNSFETALDFL